jgi:hypothetical protein
MLWHRTAQKRYRERQKEKMQDFERQVEELSSRVSALMREKANLESRNSLLERVVQLKDATEAAPPQVGLCTWNWHTPHENPYCMPLQGRGNEVAMP